VSSLRRRAGAAAVAAALLLGACSSDDPTETTTSSVVPPIAVGSAPVRIELIDDAVAAVESALGGPQRFFEVNATPTVVNLFVAVADSTQAVAYVYAAGALEAPAEPVPASGPTFSTADIDFDTERVIAQVRAELPESDFRLFSITGLDAGGVQYKVVINSALGAELVVLVSASGAILGTEQSAGIGSS
jgi:hypothetical protein